MMMAKARSWQSIRADRSKLTALEREQVNQEVQELVRKMKLGELRKARQLSQAQLAETLGLSQGDISRIEHRTDLYVSTLRRFIEATGGTLEIRAMFPGAEPIELEFLTEPLLPINNGRSQPSI
jgi:DNA-binding XRE family transcriptional regulator